MEFLHVLEPAHHDVSFDLYPEKGAGWRFHELSQIGVLFEIDIEKLLSFMNSDLPYLSEHRDSGSI
jgi:hypothetical protein